MFKIFDFLDFSRLPTIVLIVFWGFLAHEIPKKHEKNCWQPRKKSKHFLYFKLSSKVVNISQNFHPQTPNSGEAVIKVFCTRPQIPTLRFRYHLSSSDAATAVSRSLSISVEHEVSTNKIMKICLKCLILLKMIIYFKSYQT